jgi:hypothetical protein
MTNTASLRQANNQVLKLTELQESVERMRRRVRAAHAHVRALERTAEGVRWIHGQLASILQLRVARTGWTAENRLAGSALEAMEHQLHMVSPSEYTVPVEKLRLSLDHALFRADDALVLLRDEGDM